jgi:hypothetical protein
MRQAAHTNDLDLAYGLIFLVVQVVVCPPGTHQRAPQPHKAQLTSWYVYGTYHGHMKPASSERVRV